MDARIIKKTKIYLDNLRCTSGYYTLEELN